MGWAEDTPGGPASRTDVLRASPPMFESRVLDAFTRVHPVIPVVIFVPAIVALAAWDLSQVGVPAAIGLAVAGYALWTLFEYWLHRLVFHFEPQEGLGARLHWIIHGVHHDHPNDPMRLVMPPSVSVPLAALFVWVFSLVFGTPGFLPLSAGFLSGYLGYDMLHYHVHHRTATTRIGKMMRELHMRHHFQDHDTGYGVSAPFWDHVFGTAPRKRPFS